MGVNFPIESSADLQHLWRLSSDYWVQEGRKCGVVRKNNFLGRVWVYVRAKSRSGVFLDSAGLERCPDVWLFFSGRDSCWLALPFFSLDKSVRIRCFRLVTVAGTKHGQSSKQLAFT